MAGRSRTFRTLALGAVLAMGVSAPVAAGPPRTGPVDITETASGRDRIAAALARRAERGLGGSVDGLRVLRFRDGTEVVAPSGVQVLGASSPRDAAGGRAVRVDVRVRGTSDGARAPLTAAALSGPSWQWLGGDCFDVLRSTFGWSVSCYDLHRVASDGIATRDYWALEHRSVTGPDYNHGVTPNAKIYDAWIAAVRATGSPAMGWQDWSPRGDRTGPCQPIGVTISVLKLPLGGTYEMCESWDTTWYSEGGRYRNQWKCGCFFPFGVSGDREVAYQVAVWVPNGAAPSWVLSQGFLAW